MRLIDADALKKDIARLHILNDEAEIRRAYEYNPHSMTTDYEETLVSVFDAIDDAPTIEPKRGEWRFDEKGYFFCSECKRKPNDQYATTDFCPWCGADMKGASDETAT